MDLSKEKRLLDGNRKRAVKLSRKRGGKNLCGENLCIPLKFSKMNLILALFNLCSNGSANGTKEVGVENLWRGWKFGRGKNCFVSTENLVESCEQLCLAFPPRGWNRKGIRVSKRGDDNVSGDVRVEFVSGYGFSDFCWKRSDLEDREISKSLNFNWE